MEPNVKIMKWLVHYLVDRICAKRSETDTSFQKGRRRHYGDTPKWEI